MMMDRYSALVICVREALGLLKLFFVLFTSITTNPPLDDALSTASLDAMDATT